jgi:uncharacterized circularly permuted ATP-grasp superfamily protein
MALFDSYRLGRHHDEMFAADGGVRPHCRSLHATLAGCSEGDFRERQRLADRTFVQMGVTFTVYGDERGTEKSFPFDLIPRIVPAHEWRVIERGLSQRLEALNRFLHDVYHEQHILRDGVVSRELALGAAHYRPEFHGADPPGGVYVHIAGSDLIRGSDGRYMVLEDNLRTPSGASYMLENRNVLTRLWPALFRGLRVRPVNDYPSQLSILLRQLAPRGIDDPAIVLLTPGPHNSAYFEHAFLARELGVELVEGRDLMVIDNFVYMKTTKGPRRVDVVYRRIDDDFLDPLVFRPDSLLGCTGLVNAYRAGNVAVANSIGTGVADDKAVYAFVPAMIRYYLGEEPILPNVETFVGADPGHCAHILANLDKLVVKAANESGGYGMLMGPMASRDEREDFGRRIAANPRNYIAQPLIDLSTAPTFVDGTVEPRHIDLRPFALCRPDGQTVVVPGGLTRVALVRGSYVVNSSQGGGSKDTWVLEEDADALA